MDSTYEPRIAAFLCNWCSYAGADLAGVSRFQYPPNIRVVRVMCSGRVDPAFVFEALLQGADGVLVGACHLGDCHYQSGNYHTEIKIKWCRYLLSLACIDAKRLALVFVSAAEGERFATAVRQYVETVRALGSLGDTELQRCALLRTVVRDFRIRWLMGIERTLCTEGNVYGETVMEADWRQILEEQLETSYLRHRILAATKESARSAPDLAAALERPASIILRHLVALRRRGAVCTQPDEDEGIQRYRAVVP